MSSVKLDKLLFPIGDSQLIIKTATVYNLMLVFVSSIRYLTAPWPLHNMPPWFHFNYFQFGPSLVLVRADLTDLQIPKCIQLCLSVAMKFLPRTYPDVFYPRISLPFIQALFSFQTNESLCSPEKFQDHALFLMAQVCVQLNLDTPCA